MRKPIIRWDGKHLPQGLKHVPPGQYELEPVQDTPSLTEEEERGIQAALAELDAGKGMTMADVIREIRSGTRGK